MSYLVELIGHATTRENPTTCDCCQDKQNAIKIAITTAGGSSRRMIMQTLMRATPLSVQAEGLENKRLKIKKRTHSTLNQLMQPWSHAEQELR